jgi:hypothetical protein
MAAMWPSRYSADATVPNNARGNRKPAGVGRRGPSCETIFLVRRKRPETKRRLPFPYTRQGMANMQFIMNLIWYFSRSSSMAALSQGRHR